MHTTLIFCSYFEKQRNNEIKKLEELGFSNIKYISYVLTGIPTLLAKSPENWHFEMIVSDVTAKRFQEHTYEFYNPQGIHSFTCFVKENITDGYILFHI